MALKVLLLSELDQLREVDKSLEIIPRPRLPVNAAKSFSTVCFPLAKTPSRQEGGAPVGTLARIMHKFSAAVSQSSALTALCFLALLGVLHEYAEERLGYPLAGRTPCHRGACATSLRKPMHNAGP